MNAPLDATHAASIEARADIRRLYIEARARVNRWEPRPMPKGWGR